MELCCDPIQEIKGLYRIIPLTPLRHTPGVCFDVLPGSVVQELNAIDRVIHEGGAVSPGPVGDVERPWYMHPHQDDNLIVLHGTRYVDIYTPSHGTVESFVIKPNRVEKGGCILHERACLLVWPRHVFHRIRSCEIEGSASLNFAVHHDGFNVKTNFNVYSLDTQTGKYDVIRQGHRDQPGGARCPE